MMSGTHRTCQRSWGRVNDRFLGTDGKFQDHIEAWDTHRPSVSSCEEDAEAEMVKKAQAALKAAMNAGLAKEISESLQKEVESRKDKQRTKGPEEEQLDAAKKAITQTAALLTKRRQELTDMPAGGSPTGMTAGAAAIIDEMMSVIHNLKSQQGLLRNADMLRAFGQTEVESQHQEVNKEVRQAKDKQKDKQKWPLTLKPAERMISSSGSSKRTDDDDEVTAGAREAATAIGPRCNRGTQHSHVDVEDSADKFDKFDKKQRIE